MSKTITFSKTTLANLLGGLFFPNPDDSGPYGPFGPIIRGTFRDFSAVLLNPQPLPPAAGPQPEPWRSAFVARAVIDRAVANYQFAEVSIGSKQSEKITAAIGSQIREFVDDYCGTRPPKWPWPWPQKFDAAELRPIDLLAAGAQFQLAADLENPLQADFSAAADQLFETGLKRMESACS